MVARPVLDALRAAVLLRSALIGLIGHKKRLDWPLKTLCIGSARSKSAGRSLLVGL